MISLVLACVFFLFIHLIVSGTGLRQRLVGMLGEGMFLGAFSVASLVGIVWMSMAYNRVDTAYLTDLWMAPFWLSHLGGIVMLIAFLLVVLGNTTPSPTAVQVPGKDPMGLEPKGVHRITRHPFLWGVLLWAAFHLIVNLNWASIALFGSFVILIVFGTRSIDAKRRKSMGEVWTAYAQKTSNIPFAAILQGRNSLRLGEIAWWQWLAGLVAFGAFFYGHLWLFSVSPVPGWYPY